MHKVKNKKTVHRIAIKALKANRLRNVIAVIAVALTAMLFTTVFTIGMSFNEAFQQANFRQAGGYAHGSFKYLTEEQFHEFKDDPLIKEYGLRRFVGMPSDVPFNKSHVEVGYSDENQRKWMYLDPIQGNFPKEGTNEAATDTKVLSLLGIEPVVGTQFAMTFDVDGKETTETFTLSGFWEYDEAIVANHVLIPQSRVEEIFKNLGTIGKDGMTGTWNMDVMFKNSMNIEGNVQKVLANHGYQDQDQSQPNYIATGVNWGYTGAQLADSIDPVTVAGIAVLILLIIFTGYLIIYNVFQISVAGDIRFYGLLKTIGTTPKQLKRIIRKQALALSAVGIPIGLLLGYLVGVTLTPVIFAQLNGVTVNTKSASPLIFIGSALFALLTVFLSCTKPGKIAANVSPIEAVRYAEGTKSKRGTRKSTAGISLTKMALANLGRSRVKTVITVISLSLAIILLNLTFTFTNGFDMDKYLRNVVVDFTVSEAGYFQVTQGWRGVAVEEDTISLLQSQGEIVDGGRVYGQVSPMLEFSPEEYYREKNGVYSTPENLDLLIKRAERLPDGKISDRIQLYGMEDFILKKITTLNGDIKKLNDSSGNYIAAVYSEDDYGNPLLDSHWAKLGDKVTIRHIDKMEYYNPNTGEVYESIIPEGADFKERILEYRDVEYEVAALVVIPHSLSYRYYGADAFVLGAEIFTRDTGSNTTMYYAFDTTEESIPAMEKFLSEYTQSEGAQYDYESKETYRAEFESFRNMFLLLGSVLSFVIGLVGILNFLNAVLTSIIARRKEFAMLQSIGMTGKQLKIMLIWESLYYTIGAVALCLILSLATGPLLGAAFESVFWFFSYRLTVLPILICIPFMLFISYVVPHLGYKSLVKQSIVERLREVE
ncbi:FtsX-like permease family protein [Hydrogenoanaerobacterium sp.]|uniref:ABC transporter permease n=1 Tax=Hydrogenoanaerobacterium sp. TaxID=2953763 RepID=UPI002897475D|nr:FtsX-like permease family protein [Hydrogenoanaerobacterium sp.]